MTNQVNWPTDEVFGQDRPVLACLLGPRTEDTPCRGGTLSLLFKAEKWTIPGNLSETRRKGAMGQIHKRFTSEQVGFLFRTHLQGNITRTDVQETLGIGKSPPQTL
jgi:hypothetical protein